MHVHRPWQPGSNRYNDGFSGLPRQPNLVSGTTASQALKSDLLHMPGVHIFENCCQ
jgi:hypothetical protein